jgi:hypothetical protein
LPSKGAFWENNTLDLPVTGEIPVYPMTTADELTLKTPDALMNGSGVVSVIQSCCPNIRDAWKMPSVDVDAVLIAIRIASYGQHMAVTSVCPHCNEEHDYDVDLNALISKVTCPNYDIPIEYDGLKIKLHPQQYFTVNQSNITTFEEQRIIQSLNDANLDNDAKNMRVAQSMKKLLDANIQMLVNSTEYIETEDGIKVKETAHLEEFYKNAESRVTKEIEAKLSEIAKEGALPLIDLSCTDCNKEYQTPLEFDYARFFA